MNREKGGEKRARNHANKPKNVEAILWGTAAACFALAALLKALGGGRPLNCLSLALCGVCAVVLSVNKGKRGR